MRRSGKRGDHLATDDYTGMTRYASQLHRDYWGMYAVHPLERNLQEIAYPLEDPAPVSLYRGPSYEISIPCDYEVAPQYVGNTMIPTNPNNAAFQVLNLNPAIPDMTVGCTFIVR